MKNDIYIDFYGKYDNEFSVALKDNIAVKGKKLTCGSAILKENIASFDATVVSLLKNSNIPITGKTNMDEFGVGNGFSGSFLGNTTNPKDETLICGGSSQGSAKAVAVNFATVALGSDTGGSVRLPACFLGLFGLKPTYGAISRYGLVSMADSLDQIGIFSKNTRDLLKICNILYKKDEKDSTSIEFIEKPLKNIDEITVALLDDRHFLDVDESILDVYNKTIKEFESLGAKIIKLDIEHLECASKAYNILSSAELFTNISRFDGVLQGKDRLQFREENLGLEVKRRISFGSDVLSNGQYENANNLRIFLKKEVKKVFSICDILLTPTSTKLTPKFSDKDNFKNEDYFLTLANLTKIPALTMPLEKEIGMQIMGREFSDKQLIKISEVIYEGYNRT